MTIYLFAGPNGSGKSTIIADYISAYGLNDTEYICPDVYASELFGVIDDIYERYKKAMTFAEYKRERLLNEKESMIIETVLSHSDKLDFIQKAKSFGYRIVSVYISTESADINCARIKKRVFEGGHDVPEDKIRSRYNKSMNNLQSLAECSDELYVYDNSGEHPVLGLCAVDNEVFISSEAASWIKRLSGFLK